MKRESGGSPVLLESQYVASQEVSAASLAESLQSLLHTRSHPIRRQRITVLDTFNRRVRRAGAHLTRTALNGSEVLTWQSQRDGGRLTAPLKQPARFAWDFPEGPLQRMVAPAIGVRRLLDQVDAETSGSLLDILDERGKTIARLRIESGQARMPAAGGEWQQLPTLLTLTGLRGYEAAYQRLVPVVESRPGVRPCPGGVYDVMLQHVGGSTRTADSPPPMALSAGVAADAGIRQVLLGLIDVLETNEPGLRANLDSEFLHDFRVAVRRTRSLLGQIRQVLPAIVVEHFAAEFSWLGRVTGPARDLDVLVLTLRNERELAGNDLDEVMRYLECQQVREHRQLVEALDSDRYRRLRSGWRAFLSEPASPLPEAPNAKRPFVDVISQRAWRLVRRIGDAAGTIDSQTPAQIHGVRILAKKLRYLVDVAPALFDADDIAAVLDALKKTQRVLGNFNDAEVQEQRLLDYGRALGVAGAAPDSVLLLGRLAERSRQRREGLRQLVVDELRRFADRDTRSACRRAFKRETPHEGRS